LDPAVAEVTGWTRYRVEGDPRAGTAAIHVVDKGGIALGLSSRTDTDPALRGTKHRAAFEREVTVARGGVDGRTVVLVPEVKDNEVTGLSLLHVRFRDQLPADRMRAVLEGYRTRYTALVDAVTESTPTFDDAVLAEVPVVELLLEPVHVLARHWRP
jgi:glucosamine--fructose-6-phosphate aminotransferase (isomerizing)